MKDFGTFKLKKDKSKIAYSFIGNIFFAYCIAVAVALMVFSLCMVECVVTGASMQPTLNAIDEKKNDDVYINKYDKSYNYGDIVVLSTPGDSIIKRIIGLPGDLIDIVKVNGIYKLERNGEIIEEDYIYIDSSEWVSSHSKNGMDTAYNLRWLYLKEDKPSLFNADGKLIVGDNQVFVLGDHRRVSIDSTYYGNFDFKDIQGVVEEVKYYGESSFWFYWDYVVQGKFINTFLNIF